VGIIRVFSIQDDLRHGQEKLESGKEMPNPSLGYGLYEGIIFIGGALLTSIILGRVDISKFYPPLLP
jgi:hypothetical protein